MINVHFILFIFVLCALPFSLSCQKFQNVNDEFPMGLSEEIFQDSYGFLWIGTVDGLVRFDGYTAVHYNYDPMDSFSISGNNINGISEDSSGFIWVGLSLQGAAVFNRNTQHFTPICFTNNSGDCIEEISVNGFVQDGAVMWVATSLGLFAVESSKPHKVIKRYVSNKADTTSLADNYVQIVFLDKNNTLWLGTRDGVNQFNRVTEEFANYRTNPSFPKRQILDFEEDPKGTLWVSPRFETNCLYTWDEEGKAFSAVPNFPKSLGELRITWDAQDNMWLCSRGIGATRIDAISGERRFFAPLNSDFHGYENVYGLRNLKDSYGNIWYIGGSLLKWPGSNKSIQNISSNSNIVISIFAEDDFILFNSKKPYIWNKRTLELDEFWTAEDPVNLKEEWKQKKILPRIYHYAKLDDENIVLITTRNVFIWNKRSKVFREYPFDSGGPFRDFVIDRISNVMWICPNQGIPVRFDLTTKTFERPEEMRPIHGAISIELGAGDDIWIGSERWGLYRYNTKTHQIRRYTPREEDPSKRTSSEKINDLCMDRDGNLWIATSKGVNFLDIKSDSISSFEDYGKIASSHVTSVLDDANGDIWMGTYDGLIVLSRSTGAFKRYNRSDGLINANYIARSNCKDKDGMLYFGGDNGIDYIDPASIGINTIPPDVYLSGVSVNNIPVKTEFAPENLKSLKFDFDQRIIEIELLALHLTAPRENIYSYRISNINQDWIDLGKQRTITLANPNPGVYNIEVKAANSDGVWSDPKQLISITVHPPYWRTWWFISLEFIFGFALLYAIYKYRTGQVRKEERLKASFGKKIAELELRALRAQMNPHFLFNSLNSIKSLISSGENAKASEYVTRFSQLIRQVLYNSEKPFVRLEEDLEALRLYLNIERLRFQNFEFFINIDDDVNSDFIEVPPLLLQPYVENAIWHGLMHKTKGSKEVKIHIRKDQDFLVMEVEDNGIGRERARQIKMRGGSRKGGLGMRVTRDRIKLLREFYGQDASVQIEDLKTVINGVSEATGTRVTVRIPVAE